MSGIASKGQTIILKSQDNLWCCNYNEISLNLGFESTLLYTYDL